MTFRILVTLFTFSALTVTASSQIPNAGFEMWAGGSPSGWVAANSPEITTIYAVNDPHSGSFAANGKIVEVGPNVYMWPFMAAGAEGEGFPITYRPAALRGWYKFNGVGGDALVVIAGFALNQVGIGAGNFADHNTRTVYREFVAPIHWTITDVPDLATITVTITGGGGQFHPGSEYFLDNLSFGSATDVEGTGESVPAAFVLEQNFPNPFNPTTTIQFHIPEAQFVTLKVYNLLGQEVATLVNEQLSAGNYRTKLDGAGLASGTYFYRLQAGNFTATKKFQLVR